MHGINGKVESWREWGGDNLMIQDFFFLPKQSEAEILSEEHFFEGREL